MTNVGSLVLIGAGGHAKVVLATAQACGIHVTGLYDDDPRRWKSTVGGVPIAGSTNEVPEGARAIVAVGENATRARLAAAFDLAWVSLVHPRALVHSSARLDRGAAVFAGALIQPGSIVGQHAIINTGAIVDHDCAVGAFAHVAPGATLTGNVTVGDLALVGAGAVVTPGRTIGRGAVVGAGAVVVQDVPPYAIVYGVPARVTRYLSNHGGRE